MGGRTGGLLGMDMSVAFVADGLGMTDIGLLDLPSKGEFSKG